MVERDRVQHIGQSSRTVKVLEVNQSNPQANAVHQLVRWIPNRVRYSLKDRGFEWIDSKFLANGMARDKMLASAGVGQTRPEADALVDAAAEAGLVVKKQMPHPISGKMINTWQLPEAVSSKALGQKVDQPPVDATPGDLDQSGMQTQNPDVSQPVSDANPPEVSYPESQTPKLEPNTTDLRQFLSDLFSDEEITTLCYDHFPEVHNNFGTGMTKGQKIQSLLDHCQRRDQLPELLANLAKARPEQFPKRFGAKE
jgi:hypothetical protein